MLFGIGRVLLNFVRCMYIFCIDLFIFIIISPSLQGWPVNEPDIIVSTPVALLNNIDPKKIHGLNFIRGVKYVVCILAHDFVFSLVI